MKKIIEYIINFFNGFCMALSDSVPGVSGGTIAFLLGFYDKFITSLDDLFRGNIEKKKNALKYLIKIGIGWVVGFLLAATILSSLFTTKIYFMSSLFLGFILVAIPLVIKEEKKCIIEGKKNAWMIIIGVLIVVAITLITNYANLDIDILHPNLLTFIYVFIAASIAICAMVLPGVSGSTLLLVFGLYVPIMTLIKDFIHFNFHGFFILLVFGLGVIFGIVFFVRLLRKGLENKRSNIVYIILGMMIASIYSIIMGPTTLEEPLKMMTFDTFNILAFVIGALIIVGLELIKSFMNKKQ